MIPTRIDDDQTCEYNDNATTAEMELQRQLPVVLIAPEHVKQMREQRRQRDSLRQWAAQREASR